MSHFKDSRSNRIDPVMLDTCHPDHLQRYEIAAEYANGKRCLDVGCAFGYGSNILAQTAAFVQGIDLYEEGVAYAKEKYQTDKCQFAVADACADPFPPASFDLIACFKVIEHVPDAVGFVGSLRKMLKPGGFAIISTPNGSVTAPNGVFSDPTHLREYSPTEFQADLRAGGFATVQLKGQHHAAKMYEMHALRSKFGKSDVFKLGRLIPSGVKAAILNRTAQATGIAADDAPSVTVSDDVTNAHVQIAICS